MNAAHLNQQKQVILNCDGLATLIEVLRDEGHQVIGPRVRDGAILYDEIHSVEDFPQGLVDEQDGGIYRLKKRHDQALFGYAVGPNSWKKFLDPPETRLWSAKRTGQSFEFKPENQDVPKYAFIGARSCELHAIAIQDKVFMGGDYANPFYSTARENLFIVAVNCGQAGGTCFCVSMQTGPKATSGFDLALTEILEGDKHEFLVEAGTAHGEEVLQKVSSRPAQTADKEAGAAILKCTSENMGRKMDSHDIKDLLSRNYDHPRWEETAKRCLSCANCTMVCPTCFCSTVEDVTDLKGENAERWKKWDSCFTMDFSYIHGGTVRSSVASRYRQWMTHKLSTWIDQFGESGCVGCGRCITWCPVAIDITEEVQSIRENDVKEEKDGKEIS